MQTNQNKHNERPIDIVETSSPNTSEKTITKTEEWINIKNYKEDKSVIEKNIEKQTNKFINISNNLNHCTICKSSTKLIKFHKKSKDEQYICANCSPSYTFNLFKKQGTNVNERNFKLYEKLLRESLDSNLEIIKG